MQPWWQPTCPGALHAMTHPFGFQLAKKYVCVSTVGPSPEHIRRLEWRWWLYYYYHRSTTLLLLPTTTTA